MSLKTIFRNRQFSSLFWTQFLGALNDNFLKNALVVMVTFRGAQIGGLATKDIVALAGAIFIAPFFLFSPLAGQLTDKYERSKLMRYTKIWELIIMLVGVVGLYLENFELLLFVLFLMGVQSAFFGPAKYSVIPEIVPPEKLMQSNAYVEMGTFVAILLGTIGGGLATASPHATLITSLGITVFAILGIAAIWKMKPVPIGNSSLKIRYNPIPSLRELWHLLCEKQSIFNSVLAISWFWFFGAGVLSILPIYCKDYLNADETVVTAFLTMFTLGVGLGSILCDKLSRQRVEVGLVPFGSLGLTVFLVDLYFVIPDWLGTERAPIAFLEFAQTGAGAHLLIDFFLMSLFGGLFIVPLYALIQERSHPESRSRVIAANNILNALFMVVSSLTVMLFYKLGFTLPQIFLAFAILNAAVSMYIYTVVPEFTLRFLSWILANMLYRIKIKGEKNIPATGGLLLASNHVSFVDWMLVMGSVHRPPRFIMYYKFFEIPVLRYLMRQAHTIPIAGQKEDEKILHAAFQQVAQELSREEVVCIFPEGRITDTGEMAALRPGILKILAANPVPVVPMAINNLWGSMFSRKSGRKFIRAPRKLWQRIEINIGQPIPPEEFSLERLETEMRALQNPL